MSRRRTGFTLSFHALVLSSLLVALLACGERSADPLEEIRELHRSNRFEESLQPLRALLEERPGDPELNLIYGVALLRMGQAGAAVWPLRKAADAPEHAVEAGLLLTGALLESASAHDAVAAVSRVLEREPDHLPALSLRAQAHLAAQGEEQALADIERVLELDPENLDVLVPRAVALIGLRRLDEAEGALQAARARLSESEGQSEWAATLCVAGATFAQERGERERAEQEMEACLEEFPENPLVTRHAVAFFDELGRSDRGSEILRAALGKDPRFRFRRTLAARLRARGERDEAERLLLDATVERPSSPFAWAALVDHYMALEEFGAARSAVERALEVMPDASPMMSFAYAQILIAEGDYDRAERVVGELEQPVFSHLVRGSILLEQGEARAALEELEAGIRLWPDNPAARFVAAQAAEQIGDFDRAISEYRESLRADAAATEAGLELARLHEAEGKPEPGLEALRHYVNARPSDPEGYRLAVRLASRLGRREVISEGLQRWAALPGQAAPAAAEAAAIRAERNGPADAVRAIEGYGRDLTRPVNVEVLRVLVENLSAQGEHEAALTRVDAALEAHPRVAAFHELWARTSKAAGGPAQGVRDAFERAVELEPERAGALAGLAELAAERGEHEAALALYQRAAAADPGNPAPEYAAIELLAASGSSDEVERQLEDLLERHPRYAPAASRLARLLVAGGERLDRALELARRAMRFQGGAEASDTLGWVLLERGEPEGAVRWLQRSLELRPDAASTRYRLGRALAAAGDAEAARDALREALAAGSFPEAERARAELARLETSPRADP